MTSPIPFRPGPPGSKVAVVIEDDRATSLLVATTLSQTFTVYVADGASRAMQMLLEIPTPSLVVCDVAMPGVDGIQFVKELRAIPKLAATPVIFLTAKTMPMDVVAGINAGARYYMTKPFRPAELLEKAQRATGVGATK
jgi:DNA-binding response OmpR family regulator